MTTDNIVPKRRPLEVIKALAGIMVGMFVAITSLTIVGTALPTMIKDLHGSQSAYTWVVTGALLASTLGTVIAGKLADQFHKKTLLMWGFAIFAVGSLLAGFAWNTEILIVFRAIQGIGMGFQMALSGAIIASVITPRERGKYNGYVGAIIAVAMVSGPLFGGLIVDLLGWRWCFWVAIPFTLIAMWIVHRKLVVPPAPKRKPKIDYLGSVLITVGLTLFMYWMTEASKNFAYDNWTLWAILVVSLVILVGFVFWEKHAPEPLMPFAVLNTRITRLVVVTSIMLGVSQNAVAIFMGQYLQLGRGYTPTMSGLGMLPLSIGSLVASTVAGYLVSSSGKWKPAVVTGMSLLSAGSVLMIFTGNTTPYWHIFIGLTLIGFGQGAAMQNLVLAVQNTVAYKDIGASTATITFARSMGGTIGLQLLGAIFNWDLTRRMHDGALALMKQGVDAQELRKLSHVKDLSVLQSGGPVAHMLQNAYADAIAVIFFATAVLAIVGLIASIFMRSTMLRDSIDLDPSDSDGALVDDSSINSVSANTDTDNDTAGTSGASVRSKTPATETVKDTSSPSRVKRLRTVTSDGISSATSAAADAAASAAQTTADRWQNCAKKLRTIAQKRQRQDVPDTAPAPVSRTADREDLHPMELGASWELGDNVRLQKVYPPTTTQD